MTDCSKSLSICAKCSKVILSEDVVTIFDRFFHPDCFRCEKCGSDIIKGFHHNKGRFYCSACYLTFVPACVKCGDPIVLSGFIKALNKLWHVKCFVCTSCEFPFDNGKFFPINGKPYCLQDYWTMKSQVEKKTISNVVDRKKNVEKIETNDQKVIQQKNSETISK